MVLNHVFQLYSSNDDLDDFRAGVHHRYHEKQKNFFFNGLKLDVLIHPHPQEWIKLNTKYLILKINAKIQYFNRLIDFKIFLKTKLTAWIL
jgi:hypothetical protein